MSTTPQQLAAHQAAIVLAEGARQGGPGGGEGQLFRLGLRLGNVRCDDKSGGRGLLQSSYRQQRVERLGNWAFAHVARVNGPGTHEHGRGRRLGRRSPGAAGRAFFRGRGHAAISENTTTIRFACGSPMAFGRACIWARAQKCRLHRAARILPVDQHAFFEFERGLYRQPTRGGFSTVGTIVTIHRCGLRERSSWTDRTKPKNLDPFKLSSAVRPNIGRGDTVGLQRNCLFRLFA